MTSVEEFSIYLQNYLNREKIPLILLAMNRETIIGAVQFKYREMDIYPDKEYWMGGVFVPKQYRKMKVATRLIEKIIAIAQSLDVRILHLQTEKLDGGLYSLLGWKPINQLEYKGSEVLVMENVLTYNGAT